LTIGTEGDGSGLSAMQQRKALSEFVWRSFGQSRSRALELQNEQGWQKTSLNRCAEYSSS
jgi:hypothetical protein